MFRKKNLQRIWRRIKLNGNQISHFHSVLGTLYHCSSHIHIPFWKNKFIIHIEFQYYKIWHEPVKRCTNNISLLVPYVTVRRWYCCVMFVHHFLLFYILENAFLWPISHVTWIWLLSKSYIHKRQHKWGDLSLLLIWLYLRWKSFKYWTPLIRNYVTCCNIHIYSVSTKKVVFHKI